MSEISTRPDARPKPQSAEALLLALLAYGSPRVAFMSGLGAGWFACVELNGVNVGVQGQARSEFGMATPIAALAQLLERCEAAMGPREARP